MKYKLLSFAFIFLIATPVFSQEISPLIIETPKTTTPTVVKTGEPFSQTYKLRFIDMTLWGEEILVKEELLNPGVLGDFEVLDLKISKEVVIGKEFTENVWFLNYTLRIVKRDKAEYKIPPITIPWIDKKIGQGSSDPSLKTNTDFKTEEVHVNYVSTITKDPNISVRDEMNFGSFYRTALAFRISFWLLLLIPPVIWINSLFKFIKMRQHVTADTDQVSYLQDGQEGIGEVFAQRVTKGKSLSILRQNVKELGQCQGSVPLELEERLVVSLKNFLMAEFPGLNVGATPLEMSNYIESRFKNVSHGRAIVDLSKKAAAYQGDLEGRSLKTIQNPVLESVDLRVMLDQLRWYNKIYHRFLNLKSYLAGILARENKG